MRQFFLLLVFTVITGLLYSQDISVKSFRQLPNDMDARVTYPKPDQNGDKCAIIKIVTSETGFFCDGDMLGIIAFEKKIGEYWLYVPHDAKRLTIKHDKFGLLRDYEYTLPILEATVYELILGTPQAIIEPKDIINQLLTIKAEPKGAKIYINDNLESTDSLRKLMIPGNYKYRVTALFYHTDSGKVYVTPDRGENITISLKPNHGFANLTSLPKAKAIVYIDGAPTILTTPCTTGKLLSGEHSFTLVKQWFRPMTKNVTIQDGVTEEVTFEMQSNRLFVKDFYRTHLIDMNIGYYNTTFSNYFFKNNISNGNIKRGLGYAASLNFNLFPLFFDLTYFSTGFTVNNIEAFNPNSTITHRGGEFSANVIPLTLGINVYPYLGAGYQYSQLYSKSLTIEGTASSNASLPFAKAGVKVRLTRFVVFGEYKYGFDINGSGYASGQIYTGVGFIL
jgi:hypothetical protein